MNFIKSDKSQCGVGYTVDSIDINFGNKFRKATAERAI